MAKVIWAGRANTSGRIYHLKQEATSPIAEVADRMRKRYEEQGLPVLVRVVSEPGIKSLENWMMDGVCKSIDGQRVEPDGYSSAGYPSWLLAKGVI